MAVRFDANADYLRLSSGLLDYNSGYTIMCWAYPVSNPTAQITLFSVANNGSNLDRLRSNSGGTTWNTQSIVGGTSINTAGSSVSYGGWQHWAMVRRDVSNLDSYLNGVLDATSNQSVSGRAAAAQLDIGNTNSANAYFNGRVFALKAWDTALSAAEIAQEMRTIRPIRLANLWLWVPARPGSGERAKDYSGNGRNLTEGGTLTDEDPGPISWGSYYGVRSKRAILLSATIAGLSSTPDTGDLAVTRAVAATIAGLSSTPDTGNLAVARAAAATIAGLSSTPDTGDLAVARALAATIAGLSSTPDTGELAVGGFSTTIAGLSSTPDTGNLAVARAAAATIAGLSSTPDTGDLAVARAAAATIAGLSSTPDTGNLAVARAAAATIAGLSSTPDTGNLAVARAAAATIAGLSSTPDTGNLAVARAAAATIAGLSSTPDTGTLAVARAAAATIAGLSSTPDTGTLAVARALAATIAGLSSTPSIRFVVVLTPADWTTFIVPAQRRAFSVLADRRSFEVRAEARSYEAAVMGLAQLSKDPASTIDVQILWSSLLGDAATISDSTWDIEGVDANLTIDSDSHDTTTATVRLTGGTLGQKYKLRNTITRSDGQIEVRRIIVVIMEL